MYERLRDRFPIEDAQGCSAEELVALIDPPPDGLADLLLRWAGGTIGEGLYRLLTPSEIRKFTVAAAARFPELADRILCIAVDWLGRLYAIDVGREAPNGEPLLVMLDPWTTQTYEIDAVVKDFHEDELVEYGDDILATDLFRAWRDAGGVAPDRGSCVGYRIPRSAGGPDEAENLVAVDLARAWSAEEPAAGPELTPSRPPR